MKQYFIFLISQFLFLLLLFIFLPTVLLRTQPGPQNTLNQKTLPLDRTYNQSFSSPGGHLSSVSILLKNPQTKSHQAFDIKIYLQEQLVDSITLNGINVTDPGWLPFKTQPIASRQGDIFIVSIIPHQPQNDLYILTDQSDQMNFQTSFSYNLSDSFAHSLLSFKTKIINTNKLFLAFYLTSLMGLNLFLAYNCRRTVSQHIFHS